MESIAKTDTGNGRLAAIRQAILKKFPKSRSPKFALLKQAFLDAEFYHGDQFRMSGEPAIIHPYRVALLVSEAGMGIEAVIIALLHDIIEDTEVTKSEIEAKYGVWLAEAVDGGDYGDVEDIAVAAGSHGFTDLYADATKALEGQP